MNTGEPGQTFISAAYSYLPLRDYPLPKLLLFGNKLINLELTTLFIILD